MDLFHWERFEPNVGENHSLPEDRRLFLEVACGLTKVQLKACARGLNFDSLAIDGEAAKLEAEKTGEPLEDVSTRMMAALCVDKAAAEWGPYVRIGGGPHTLGGREVKSLKDYLSVLIEQPGWFNLLELSRVIGQMNSVTGSRALFSGRLSGGPIFTAAQRPDAESDATGSR